MSDSIIFCKLFFYKFVLLVAQQDHTLADIQYTELTKYYARLQTAVARGHGLPVGRLAGRHSDAAPKHSLLFQFSFRVDGHAHQRTLAKRRR